MKKLLNIASLMAALSGVASAAPYVLPSPQPGALTPYDIQPHYGIDAIYTISGDNEAPDLYGVRLSFNLYSSGEDSVRHQFSLNVTPQLGSKDITNADGYKCESDIRVLPFTGGYDLNLEITDKTLFYMGGKAGYALAQTEEKDKDTHVKTKDHCRGFTFSVGAGFKYQPSDAIMLKLGYEFGKMYLEDNAAPDSIYTGHSIILGVSCQF
ncbi:MAG: outer membrane protein [Akkermansia sp.]